MGEEGVAGVGLDGVYAGGGGDLAEAEEPPPADGSQHAGRGLGLLARLWSAVGRARFQVFSIKQKNLCVFTIR